jgi:hypothetical protein
LTESELWKERPEELEEEEEAMAEERVFWLWRRMRMQTARLDLNKGNSGRWFNAEAVFESMVPEQSNRPLRRS